MIEFGITENETKPHIYDHIESNKLLAAHFRE